MCRMSSPPEFSTRAIHETIAARCEPILGDFPIQSSIGWLAPAVRFASVALPSPPVYAALNKRRHDRGAKRRCGAVVAILTFGFTTGVVVTRMFG